MVGCVSYPDDLYGKLEYNDKNYSNVMQVSGGKLYAYKWNWHLLALDNVCNIWEIWSQEKDNILI